MATLDELQAQLAALTQRVNEITAPPDDYYTHRFSGEEIDNAVGRVAATAGSGAITAGDVGAAPNGFGWGNPVRYIWAASANETYEEFCAKVDAVLQTMQDRTAALVSAYPPAIYGRSSTTVSILYKGTEFYAELYNVGAADISLSGWRMIKLRYPDSGSPSMWMPFEWVNPPMELGVEYRTVERHNGKPVYTKLVDCGAMPNNTSKTIEYTDDVSARPISVTGTWDNGTITMPGENGTSGFPTQLQSISLLNRNILIVTHTDRSSSAANATVKYWKATD